MLAQGLHQSIQIQKTGSKSTLWVTHHSHKEREIAIIHYSRIKTIIIHRNNTNLHLVKNLCLDFIILLIPKYKSVNKLYHPIINKCIAINIRLLKVLKIKQINFIKYSRVHRLGHMLNYKRIICNLLNMQIHLQAKMKF